MREDDLTRKLTESLNQARPVTLPSADDQAGAILSEFTAQYPLPTEAEARLRTLILAAIGERLEEVIDARVGRVLGGALAHL